jgi:hypothetical protein
MAGMAQYTTPQQTFTQGSTAVRVVLESCHMLPSTNKKCFLVGGGGEAGGEPMPTWTLERLPSFPSSLRQ